jgi:Tol biopolymer transport system component
LTATQGHFASPLLAFLGPPGSELVIVDVSSATSQPIRLEGGGYVERLYSWSPDGCSLTLEARKGDGSFGVINMAILGGTPEEIYRSPIPPDGEAWLGPELSPDERFVAYLAASGAITGDFRLAYERQDVEVRRINGQEEVHRLTQNGGGRGISWSPDSSRVLFSDYDEHGVLQVYVASADGSGRTRLSANVDPLAEPGEMSWSPDGSRVAFTYEPIEAPGALSVERLYVSDAHGGGETLVENGGEGVQEIWWESNESLVAFVEPRLGGSERSLISIDADSGAWTGFLPDNLANTFDMFLPRPIAPDNGIGFLTYEVTRPSVHIFDRETLDHSVLPLPTLPFVVNSWFPGPMQEVKCSIE